MKTVIVTGGRTYSDFAMVSDLLDFLAPDQVVQGGAAGADKLARQWCEGTDVECVTCEALWELHGKKAGPIRNREMLEAFPEAVVIAFPGGRGTADCVRAAIERNHIVLQVAR